MHWCSVVPLAVVTASLAMIPRLNAEESLLAMRRVAVGTGSLKQDSATTLQNEWIRVANGPRAARVEKARPHQLRAMGIGHRRVARRPEAAT